jgi:hypothetical protein
LASIFHLRVKQSLLESENGAWPMPILMGGGASQSSLRGGIVMPPVASTNAPGIPGAPPRARIATGAGGGPSADAIIDKFIRDCLAADPMKMGPLDGQVDDSAHNWVLGGEATEAVLVDARAGSSFKFARSLHRSTYQGKWFDPATGDIRDAGTISGAAGTVVAKPDDKEWLLLLNVS